MNGISARIIELLTTHRLPLADEKLLQEAIADVFETAALDFDREVHLGPRDIVDFMVYPDGPPSRPLAASCTVGTAVEIKIKGSRRAIYRQLERYCGYDSVAAILLATNVPMALPIAICGKPTAIAALGRGWL